MPLNFVGGRESATEIYLYRDSDKTKKDIRGYTVNIIPVVIGNIEARSLQVAFERRGRPGQFLDRQSLIPHDIIAAVRWAVATQECMRMFPEGDLAEKLLAGATLTLSPKTRRERRSRKELAEAFRAHGEKKYDEVIERVMETVPPELDRALLALKRHNIPVDPLPIMEEVSAGRIARNESLRRYDILEPAKIVKIKQIIGPALLHLEEYFRLHGYPLNDATMVKAKIGMLKAARRGIQSMDDLLVVAITCAKYSDIAKSDTDFFAISHKNLSMQAPTIEFLGQQFAEYFGTFGQRWRQAKALLSGRTPAPFVEGLPAERYSSNLDYIHGNWNKFQLDRF